MTEFEKYAFSEEGGWKYDPRIDKEGTFSPEEVFNYEEKAFNAGIDNEKKRVIEFLDSEIDRVSKSQKIGSFDVAKLIYLFNDMKKRLYERTDN